MDRGIDNAVGSSGSLGRAFFHHCHLFACASARLLAEFRSTTAMRVRSSPALNLKRRACRPYFSISLNDRAYRLRAFEWVVHSWCISGSTFSAIWWCTILWMRTCWSRVFFLLGMWIIVHVSEIEYVLFIFLNNGYNYILSQLNLNLTQSWPPNSIQLSCTGGDHWIFDQLVGYI